MGPLGPIQSVLMTSCLALLFLFLFASLLEEVIVHSSWYVLHISLLASLKNQDTKYKGFGWSIVKPLNCCPKTKDIGFSLLAGSGGGRKWEKDLGSAEIRRSGAGVPNRRTSLAHLGTILVTFGQFLLLTPRFSCLLTSFLFAVLSNKTWSFTVDIYNQWYWCVVKSSQKI